MTEAFGDFFDKIEVGPAITKVFKNTIHIEFLFGIEQEYVLFDRYGKPYGWVGNQNSGADEGKSYCGVGGKNVFAREIADYHLQLCLTAGIKICGINLEVMTSQMEYQFSPLSPVEAGDHLFMARYISFHPKPYGSNFSGSGAHVNFSTKNMRNDIKYIYDAIDKLRTHHAEFVQHSGVDNLQRLNGAFETSNPDVFSYGLLDRTSSVRIPIHVLKDGRGYCESRIFGANIDGYLVVYLMCKNLL